MDGKAKYVFLLILQSLIFGFSFVVVKKLLEYNCPPFMLISVRFLIGVLALYAVGLIIGTINKSAPERSVFNRKEVEYGLIAGVVLLLAFGLQTYGASYTTPAKNGLFTGLFVVFVPLIAMIINKKILRKAILLSLISFGGVAIVANVSYTKFSINIGDTLTIFCALGFAVHFILLEKYAPRLGINAINFTVVQLFAVALLAGIASLILEYEYYPHIQWQQALLWLVFMGVIATSITYYIQTIVQAKLAANTVSVISTTESVFAVSIALLLGYEVFSLRLFVGAVIIVLSMILASIDLTQTTVQPTPEELVRQPAP